MYHHYGIHNYQLEEKMFGVFRHTLNNKKHPLLRGFDDEFFVPHSRHTEVLREEILQVPELEILAESAEAGVYLVASRDGRQVFATGHAEYDADNLYQEYIRDLNKGDVIQLPQHYFPNDDPHRQPMVRWKGHANLLFSNWLNYLVYQATPYDINEIR
jgi:homoserine O-succinyltransferase